MAYYRSKYELSERNIYRNNGILKDAYYFNLVEEGGKEAGKPKRTISFSLGCKVYRLLTVLIFINYLFLYSIVGVIRNIISLTSAITNQFVLYLVRISLKANQQ